MPSPADVQLVNDFWNQYVDGYIFTDLRRAVAAGDNYLVALGEMCYVDFLGKLRRGKRGCRLNFNKFVSEYMPSYASILDRLYLEVRCGLVHSYFPDKVEVIGITWANPGPAIRIVNNRWKIAVQDFCDELKTAADALKRDLLAGTHFREFKQVVMANPGLNRIGMFGQRWQTSPVPGSSTTVVTASAIVNPTSGSTIQPPP